MPFIDTTEDIKRKYEKTGNAFKAIMMLHGPPGCGKSSLIKATIKKTGRHCVLVPWTKIKTCDDFVSLFRPIKINNRVYQQNELIIVFEDFDANDNDIIKARTGLKPKVEVKAGVKKDIKDFTTAELLHLASFNLKDIPSTTFTCKESDSDFASSMRNGIKRYDELTLEYILNVLDGIVELHESIVFFTTNDIDIIDPALKRNGRVNYILNMEYTDQKTMREMISYHYSVSVPLKRIPVKSKMSYADLSAICNYCKTVDECLDTIRNKI
jgi:chaperone BCS1